jgi:hypothetical protein
MLHGVPWGIPVWKDRDEGGVAEINQFVRGAGIV